MCVLSIKVSTRKWSGNLFNDSCSYSVLCSTLQFSIVLLMNFKVCFDIWNIFNHSVSVCEIKSYAFLSISTSCLYFSSLSPPILKVCGTYFATFFCSSRKTPWLSSELQFSYYCAKDLSHHRQTRYRSIFAWDDCFSGAFLCQGSFPSCSLFGYSCHS